MNKKDLILYVHGWNSHANARKAKLLESELKNHEVFETSSITLKNHPREVIKQLTEYISEKQNEYNIHLVGSSLGGYYSVFLAETLNLKATMINPAVWAYKIFENDRGENENPNTGEKYFIDQDWVDSLEEIFVHRQFKMYLKHFLITNMQKNIFLAQPSLLMKEVLIALMDLNKKFHKFFCIFPDSNCQS